MNTTLKYLMGITIIVSFVGFAEDSFAYKVSTHRTITKSALNKAQNYSDFVNSFNLDTLQTNKAVIDGSEWEDGETENDWRWFNHYYDPVNQKGLDLPDTKFDGRISKEWGYNGGSGTSGYRPCSLISTCAPYQNQYSWVNARLYMHIALTGRDFNNNLIASTQDARNKYFQLMFRSVGQVAHLVQDVAQPSHVRNDPHASKYENRIGSIALNPSRLEDWAQNNGGFISGYASSAGTPRNYSIYDSYFITLASITNTNFFSDDTIFKNYYYPSREQTDFDNFTFINFLSIVVDEDGKISKSVYITKTGGALTGYKAAQAGYFWKDISSHVIGGLSSLQFQIDDRVAEENAKILIPKAVEYSAGLLNYFFRGQINMEKDPNNSSQYVIKNESDEYMTGTFSLYYDDTSDNRRFITSWGRGVNAKSQSEPVTFTEPTDAKEKGKYILVFQGILGTEQGAVVGRAVTLACGGDIWEDWECGFTGKHSWTVNVRSKLKFEVVDGFGGNPSKVLMASGPSVFGRFSGYILYLQTSVERPKKVSFDYYVKSSVVEWDFGWIFLFLYSQSEMIIDEVWIEPQSLGCWTWTRQFDGLRFKGCSYRVGKDRWIHVEQDLLPGTGKIENIGIGFDGYTVSPNNPFEVYIDNIDFKY